VPEDQTALNRESAADQGSARPADSDSWYLDPLAALQKRNVHLELVRDWAGDLNPQTVVKTDVFEEANNQDAVLPNVKLGQSLSLGFDVELRTVAKAHLRYKSETPQFLNADTRNLPFASDSLELIISTSTLDHFETRAEFVESIRELARVLHPQGRMILTMDNPWNPGYFPLYALFRLPFAPFKLGYTPTCARLDADLRDAGLTPQAWRALIHNPRMITTLILLGLRKLFGASADGVVSSYLNFVAKCEHLPTRWFTCVFMAVCVVKGKPNAA
jgi:SAM-dependent methyltransferase